jgi:hypothetical protein
VTTSTNPVISEEQALAKIALQRTTSRLELLAKRVKQGVWANDLTSLLKIGHDAQEATLVVPRLLQQLDEYLDFILPQHTKEERVAAGIASIQDARRTDPDRIKPPPRTLDSFNHLRQINYRQPPGSTGLTVEAVRESVAAVKAARDLDLIPSPLKWPEAIELLKPSIGLEMLLHWGQQRHDMWDYRQAGVPKAEWQVDEYLRGQKFCNTFRVLDFISQKSVQISNDELSQASFADQFVRIVVLKLFNEWSTYELLREELGEDPKVSNFDPQRYQAIAQEALRTKRVPRLFRPAYRPGIGLALLDTLQSMLQNEVPHKFEFDCHNLYDVAALLGTYHGVGGFFAAQWALDLAYGPHLGNITLDNFCLAGPGGKEGLSLCFMPREWTYAEINQAILILHEHQDESFQIATGRPAPRLAGRPPFPMDVQNMCCELQKHLKKTADPYHGQGGKQTEPHLPKWWTKEVARSKAVTDYERDKLEGKIAATRILGRLKERIAAAQSS